MNHHLPEGFHLEGEPCPICMVPMSTDEDTGEELCIVCAFDPDDSFFPQDGSEPW